MSTPARIEPGGQVEKSAAARHYNDLWTLAKLTSDTEMVPKALRRRPDAVLAVMVYGHELGLQPMTALREIFIIEGTPSCSAKLMRALILRAGHRLAWRHLSADKVVLYGERFGGPGEAEVTWTIDDAKTAGVASKEVWKRYPRAMLAARATSELARLIFPEVTIGYTPEELGGSTAHFGDYDAIDVDADDLPVVVDAATGEILDVDETDELDADGRFEPPADRPHDEDDDQRYDPDVANLFGEPGEAHEAAVWADWRRAEWQAHIRGSGLGLPDLTRSWRVRNYDDVAQADEATRAAIYDAARSAEG